MYIEFDNFIIRHPEVNDAEKYLSYVLRNNKHIASSAPNTVKRVIDRDSSKLFIEDRMALAEKKECFTFLLFDQTTTLMIAQIIIFHIDWTIPKGELGYHIDSNWQGKGITSRFVEIVSEYAFNQLGFNKLFMRTQDVNIASKRIAEKNNFIQEGLLRKDFRNNKNELVDVIYFGKCKE